MMNQVPFCRQQRSGRVAPIGECMPSAGDAATAVRPNPDQFYSSHFIHAFTSSGLDEVDVLPIEYPTTRSHGGGRLRGVNDIT
jgi:hypothetical protein